MTTQTIITLQNVSEFNREENTARIAGITAAVAARSRQARCHHYLRPARNNKTNLHDIGSTATCAWFRHRELTGSCRRPASCDVVMCIVRVMIAICGPYYVASQRTVLEVNCNSLVTLPSQKCRRKDGRCLLFMG